MKPLAEQVVVVTGASSGIGRCASEHLAARGARLVLMAREEEPLEEVAHLIRERGGRAVAAPGDVSRAEDVDRAARRAVESFGRIDTWVNNASIFIQGCAEQIEPHEYERLIAVNLLGTILGTRRAILQMKEQGGGGVIVEVSSIVAEWGAPYFGAYAASKRAVVGFAQSVRAELWGTGIRVSMLYLPSVNTPIYEHARSKFGTMPRPAPPVWAPEAAARAIADLAESGKPRRHVGWFHWIYTAPGRVAERFGDWFLHRTAHYTRTDLPQRSDNLDEPAGPWAVEGRWHSRGPLRGLSPVQVARTFPVATGLLGAAVGALALLAVRRR